jgi:hypothetical protein
MPYLIVASLAVVGLSLIILPSRPLDLDHVFAIMADYRANTDGFFKVLIPTIINPAIVDHTATVLSTMLKFSSIASLDGFAATIMPAALRIGSVFLFHLDVLYSTIINTPYQQYAHDINESFQNMRTIVSTIISALGVLEYSVAAVTNEHTARAITVLIYGFAAWGMAQILLTIIWFLSQTVRILIIVARIPVIILRRLHLIT